MRPATTTLFLCLALLAAPAALRAEPTVVPIPSVNVALVDEAGAPVRDGLVAVTFLGTHGKPGDPNADVVKLDAVMGMSDENGKLVLESLDLPLVDETKASVRLLGARVVVTAPAHAGLQLDVANVHASGAAVVAVFITGMFTAPPEGAPGGFWAAVARGREAVAGHRFAPAYVAALGAAPLVLAPEAPARRRMEAFDRLHEAQD